MRRYVTLFVIPLACIGLMMGAARPDEPFQFTSTEEPSLLYATAEFGTKLVAANLEAMRVRVIGPIGYTFALPLAFCPSEGEARQKVVTYTMINTFDRTKAQLAKLDLGTGAATLVGSPHGQGLNIMAMTCSPDGTLYAIGQNDPTKPDFNSLYTVDRETGFASLLGSTTSSEFLMALAFAPDGTLYGVNVSTLFRLNPYSGEATKVVDFVGVGSVMGLAIDENGRFYVADFVPQSKIYTLDLHTGQATPILNTGLPFVHNIAFKPPHDGCGGSHGRSHGDRDRRCEEN